jgi:3-oxoacyl-[acyl-carrier-protein] synthase I
MKTVYQLADNIVSSLGFTTEETMNAILSGRSGVRHFPAGSFDLPEEFYASKVDDDQLEAAFSSIRTVCDATRFEKMALLSVYKCADNQNIDLSSPKTLFILSTTKGNVGLLADQATKNFPPEQVFLSHSAEVITRFFKNPNTPIVVSNACISGVSAQIVAKRLLQCGAYDHVVVVGADELSKFIVSGFQSFKSLAPDICKPFDINRLGLNLGEGAATIIYGSADNEDDIPAHSIILADGAITNDANHISGPSRTGEGLYLALKSIVLSHNNEIGFINAHGTATAYNDEMESIAIRRAGLLPVPVFSLKAYLGHTLGAAGVIETIISSESLKRNVLIESLGYEQCGVSNPLNIIQSKSNTPLKSGIKMISGFGGCNAALLLKKVC